ncbi:FAD-binding oxidoreductase [Cylindrospermopsis raciborskii]|jgi:glycolate oxidase FAD binding subunit|uniref:FAD-binding oxidoreductase n=1 Tax=Cylindrospermopsis raciborskii TaxID=77022 RepID=UPI001F293980|nr:FAD-binding oxidoreductase [Cylindrospermopsis raciborskii]UJL34389.1 FAD-binding oxidoreductase [Cylindrospermopsis raciborskii Cr2010]UJS03928.1 FAD-binding oxidoreductase [Cylindrospermopsis raciborskii KLL07]
MSATSQFLTLTGINKVTPWEELGQTVQERVRLAMDQTHPSCMVYPQTQEELSTIIATANSNRWRVLTCGGMTKINWGGLTSPDIIVIVSTEYINKLIEHAVGDLTITVEAGIKFREIQEILGKRGQTLGLDPAFPEHATIGGIVATGDTGSLRQRYGGVRDQLLGITFVRADGKIAKAGGRVVKNVAGYDLMKLLTGAYGTLGVISQVTLRVYPLPETSGTVILTGQPEPISQVAKILQSSQLTPTQADLISHGLVSQLGLGDGIGLMVRFQSIENSVQQQLQRCSSMGEELGLTSTVYLGDETKQEASLWQQLPELIYNCGHNWEITAKIGVLPTAAVNIISQIQYGLIHLNSGLGLVRLEDENPVLTLRSLCQENLGFLSMLSAPVTVKKNMDVWGYNANNIEIMRRIKQQFDPNSILNPGRFIGGI